MPPLLVKAQSSWKRGQENLENRRVNKRKKHFERGGPWAMFPEEFWYPARFNSPWGQTTPTGVIENKSASLGGSGLFMTGFLTPPRFKDFFQKWPWEISIPTTLALCISTSTKYCVEE